MLVTVDLQKSEGHTHTQNGNPTHSFLLREESRLIITSKQVCSSVVLSVMWLLMQEQKCNKVRL
jgi:hypothetical protein